MTETSCDVETEYRKLVLGIKRNLKSDIECRFRIGEMVDRSLTLGVAWSRITADVGISRATLESYVRTWKLWGSDRAPNAKAWSHYSYVAYLDADLAQQSKADMLAGATSSDVEKYRKEHFRRHPTKWSSEPNDGYYTLGHLQQALRQIGEDGAHFTDNHRAQIIAAAQSILDELGAAPNRRRFLRRAA